MRLAILLSGRGSNFEAMHQAIVDGRDAAEIADKHITVAGDHAPETISVEPESLEAWSHTEPARDYLETHKTRLARTLEGEAGFNDPVAILLVLVMIKLIQHADYGVGQAILFFTRELIVGRGTQVDLRRHAKAAGMRSLQESACDLIDGGQTTIAEAMRTVYVL